MVDRHGGTVLRVCRAVLAGPDADDAWSETFLAALRAYPALAADANLEAWLVTIAHRKAIDVLRARRRSVPVGSPGELAAAAEAPAAGSISGGGAGAGAGRDLDLWSALGKLSERQRQALAYHYLAGLPYREVAGIVGGSADAVRRAAADGIAALRRSKLMIMQEEM